MDAALLDAICREAQPLVRAARGRRIVVWGAGEVGARLIGELGESGVAFVDKNPLKHGTLVAGRRVHPPARLPALAGDEVWVAVLSDVESVRAELLALGLVEGRDFRVPCAGGKRLQVAADLPRVMAFLARGALAGARVLEIGYGGQPWLALCALSSGARSVVVSDVTPQVGAWAAGDAAWRGFLAQVAGHAPGGRAPAAEEALARIEVCPDAAPAERLPFPDASFDAVTSTGVLEHVDDPERSIAEVARVLRAGGRALCLAVGLHDHRANDPRSGSTPWSFLGIEAARWRAYEANAYHQNRARAADWRRACERHGLSVERSESVVDARLTAAEAAGFAEPWRAGYTLAELAELDLWLVARKR